jgi:hypothetical protein
LSAVLNRSIDTKSLPFRQLAAPYRVLKGPSIIEIIENPDCPCSNGNQTADHLLYDCNKLNNESEKLIAHISKEDNWPIRKSELVKEYLKQLIHFTNSIDYEKL